MKLRHISLAIILLMTVCYNLAQNDPPAPQFLLRQDNQLLLIDGYTGDTTELDLILLDGDTVEWSPDGTYLIIRSDREDTYLQCLNLYAVDAMKWVTEESISCDLNLRAVLMSADDSQLLYITTDTQNDALWFFDVATKSTRKLFETTEGDEAYNDGLARLEWSPAAKYVTFDQYESIMGGARNSLVVMDMATFNYFLVQAPRLYYADYNPIWSADDAWFLIMLKDVYQVSSTIGAPEQLGDVYLVNLQSEEKIRLTFTPGVEERDIHWTDEGEIAFTEVLMNDVVLTLDDAQNIEPVPEEDIIHPEAVSIPQFGKYWMARSPDPGISAWYGFDVDEDGGRRYKLTIGTYQPENIVFTTTSDQQLQTDAIAIGWRPTDYVFPQE